ncbi:MAG: MlaD family protein [Solirubrobacterales bacterium]
MNNRSPMQALASSPTMVGAITVLIVLVAVFLAYNANNGLPFVPTYRVSVEVPNSSRLTANNEVRIGGSRVGVIESIEAVRDQQPETAQTDTGAPRDQIDTESPVIAQLNLRLDKSVEPLPQDSIFRIRYKSSFGLKFLEITRGSGEPAPPTFVFDGTNDTDDPDDDDDIILSLEEVDENVNADDGTFIAQTEFDQIGNTFDQRTRNAGRANLVGFGNAFAGRGASLNLAIESLRPLFTNLKPVAENLTASSTRFRRLFPELADSARIVAPAAAEQAELFTNMANTFDAISRDPGALQETISEGPPTLRTGIELFPAQQTFLAEFTDLSNDLRPGVRELRRALPNLNQAIRVGTPVLNRTPQLNRDLAGVFSSLEDLVDEPTTKTSLVRLEDTFTDADSLARSVVPTQVVCNLWNYMWTLLPEHLTERDNVGYTQRVTVQSTPPGSLAFEGAPGALIDVPGLPDPLDIGGMPITVPGEVQTGISLGGYSGFQANGRMITPDDPKGRGGEFEPREFPILHGNPGGPTGQDGSDCQAGQFGYALKQVLVPGQDLSNPAVVKPDIPGDRGPTTAFWQQNGDRVQKDTRVPGRQPTRIFKDGE